MIFDKEVYGFMHEALIEAQKAANKEEVPIGCVVVYNNRIVGRGHNGVESLKDPTAHAEMIAITSAASTLNSNVLDKCDIYITVEPCIMCTGAILLSRFRNVFFGAFEPKTGACGSSYNLIENSTYHKKIKVFSGVLEQESKELLTYFFKNKR